MDLTQYVELVRRELALAADAGGDDARDLAERLTAPLESAIRLTLLEALSAATAEITRDLAPGSVHLRLSGRDPDFVVTPPPADAPATDAYAAPVLPASATEEAGQATGAGSSRINLRLPDDVRTRVEDAAGRERISVNAWLVRAAVAALHAGPGATAPPASGRRLTAGGESYTGWAR